MHLLAEAIGLDTWRVSKSPFTAIKEKEYSSFKKKPPRCLLKHRVADFSQGRPLCRCGGQCSGGGGSGSTLETAWASGNLQARSGVGSVGGDHCEETAGSRGSGCSDLTGCCCRPGWSDRGSGNAIRYQLLGEQVWGWGILAKNHLSRLVLKLVNAEMGTKVQKLGPA